MTILHEPVWSAVGGSDTQAVVFESYRVRENFAGTGTITKKPIRVRPVDDELLTPDLDPGLTWVTIGMEPKRLCDIPDSGVPIRLQPLWDAAEPTPTGDVDGFVRNAGGVPRIQIMSEGQYTALVAPDPNTIYILFPD